MIAPPLRASEALPNRESFTHFWKLLSPVRPAGECHLAPLEPAGQPAGLVDLQATGRTERPPVTRRGPSVLRSCPIPA
jgi:hypothetical protein